MKTCQEKKLAPLVKWNNSSLVMSNPVFDSPPEHQKRSLAQSGSASALGAEGRKFESCNSDQKRKLYVRKR